MKNEKSRFFYNYFKRLQAVNIVYIFKWLALCLVPLNTYEITASFANHGHGNSRNKNKEAYYNQICHLRITPHFLL